MPEPSETPYLRTAFLAGPVAAVASVGLAAAVVVLAGGLIGGSLVSTLRTAAHVWLTSMGSGVTADGMAVTAIPIGALLVVAFVVSRVVRWSLPDPVDELPAFVISTAGAHGLAGAVVAAAVSAVHMEHCAPAITRSRPHICGSAERTCVQ